MSRPNRRTTRRKIEARNELIANVSFGFMVASFGAMVLGVIGLSLI